MSAAATTLLLIRHAQHDLVGRALASRIPGVRLNAEGERQAQALAAQLASWPVHVIYSSPSERALATAAPLAHTLILPIHRVAELDDIEFGAWAGKSFTELASDPEWPVWCTRRTAAHPPGGETIAEVQARVVLALGKIASLNLGKTVAVFSHCDVIKAALAQYLGISLDNLEHFEISPASISEVQVGQGWAKVWRMNGAVA